MACALRYKLGKAVKSTPSPPIALAKAWGAAYIPTVTRPLIDLSQGVPGIPPPPEVLEAVGKAARDPANCGYGPMNGELSMRTALAEEMKVTYGENTDITPDDVSLTAGCNMSFVAVAMALADAGDEVILPVPWYFNHQMTLQMLGVHTIPLPCDASNGFMPSVELCANLITEKTRAIVLVSPNNPTGAILSPALIASFSQLASVRGVALVIDETYRDLITTGAPHKLFGSDSSKANDWEWRKTFIHLFSFSKSYCVPGHRLGAIIASPLILEQINTVLDCMQICPPRPIQAALSSLLPTIRPFIRDTAASLAKRHALFRSILPDGWTIGSQGGYYAFVRHPLEGVSALDVSMRLAKEIGVVTLPASFFGFGSALGKASDGLLGVEESDDRWIRFSIANVDEECLKEVTERLLQCERSFRKC
ncbi:PLP-dependent transferase [Hysterangium stoloniferum]|nr:PLP-dependent transferase [Hysterangium stoloniferum]